MSTENLDQLAEKVEQLPEHLQVQVLHYVEFLIHKYGVEGADLEEDEEELDSQPETAE